MNRVNDYLKAFSFVTTLILYVVLMYWLWQKFSIIWPIIITAPLVLLGSATLILHSTASIKCNHCGKEYGANVLLSGLHPWILEGKKCQWCGKKNV